jgi:Caspase domain/Tetratricopeptide repeat
MRLVTVLLLSLMVAMTAGQSALAQVSGTRFALVIGNAKYPDSDAPLKDAINDARALGKELRRNGFDVDVGENLTKDAMRNALERLYGKIKPGSVALIFFSGYGIQSNRQSYMIPVDAQIWIEGDVRRDGFSVDTMLNQMNTKGAKIKIAILNASRRNPFERRFRPVAAGLAPVIAPPDTMIMYASAPGTVVSDSSSDQSLFVTELIKELQAPRLSGEEVFTHTRLSMTRASRGEQTPWFSSSLAEEFYFNQEDRPNIKSSVAINSVPERKPANRPESKPEPKPEPKPESRPAPPTNTDADARRDYQRAGQIGTRKAWSDFLDKHPTGHYADLAHDRLAKLEPPSASAKPEPEKPAPAAKPSPDDDAIRDLNRRIQDNPKDANAHYKRGILYAKNGEFGRAIKDFNEVVLVNPEDADALNNRCWARAMLDELQTALKDCDEALRIRPRFADALDSRGFVKLKIGLPRNAITDYDAALRINAKQASSLYGRGIAKRRSGNSAGGNSDIEAAKAINSRIAEEFANYGIH